MKNKLHIVVDVEADGPCPGLYSMVCFGAAIVEPNPRGFYGKTRPISPDYIPDALKVSGFTRAQHASFDDPLDVMENFKIWLDMVCESSKRPVFVSDNIAFDWQFINFYAHKYLGHNPFGFSARRIGDFYAGLTSNFDNQTAWKKFRKTKHDHHPVNDAIGNAEALLAICDKYNIKI